MLSKTILLASIATMAMAQTSSTCAAQLTLDSCINSIKGQIAMCETSDYDCLCFQYGNLLTCYANCPSDTGVSAAQQQRTQYCAAASAYPSTSSRASSSAFTTALSPLTSSAHTTSASAGTATGTSHTGSSTASASSAAATTHANAGSSLEIGGGVVAILFAGLGLLA